MKLDRAPPDITFSVPLCFSFLLYFVFVFNGSVAYSLVYSLNFPHIVLQHRKGPLISGRRVEAELQVLALFNVILKQNLLPFTARR